MMLKKSYTKTGKKCRVTFKLPADVQAETAVLCGEFNEWDTTTNPMKQLKDGSFSATVSLPADRTYRFRYLLDGERWENDWEADAYVPNQYGVDDSLVIV
ncbi:MAG TPA: glycoside hydrolase [Chloroflexi bacterium]|nr:glycoside hydrolase [Chloroflexota bacterium]